MDECAADSACLNGATCFNTVGSHACSCPAEYTGSRCETDMHRCRSSPCHNDGACVDLPNHFRCECRLGFTGLLCDVDVDECETAPCDNGALCVNEVINPLVTWYPSADLSNVDVICTINLLDPLTLGPYNVVDDILFRYVTSHPGRLSLVPSVGW